MRICIDPGHSGSFEPGACAGGYKEADVVMAISLLLAEILQRNQHEVVLTRTRSIFTDELQFRCDAASDFNADIFLSLHCNAAENPRATGTEVFHYPGSVEGGKLAGCIQKEIVASMGTVDRGVKFANFMVLRETNCPAVLIELAFISNEGDRSSLTDLLLRRGFAVAVARGVEAYSSSIVAKI